jgi:predicted methyltransferase
MRVSNGHFIRRAAIGLAIGFLALGALLAAAPSPSSAQDYAALIAAPDRSEADRQTDQRRDPVKLLAFTGVRTGMKVLDIGAGGGYSTELMARAVGPTGTVHGQDSADSNARAKERFEARMKTPAMTNVVPLARNFDDPLPAGVGDFDLITFFFFYHDTTYMAVDRAEMNRKLFAALKPGAFLIIADHSAKPGTGISVGKTLHRIEESALKREVEAAGFKLVAEADFLRHPEDPRDEPIFRPKVPVDEFVLKFQRPR